MKAFINGRRVFGTPLNVFPPVYISEMVSTRNVDFKFSKYLRCQIVDTAICFVQEYFFDPEVLTEGEVAPNDRCCRICGKIGHFMKDCPMRKK